MKLILINIGLAGNKLASVINGNSLGNWRFHL